MSFYNPPPSYFGTVTSVDVSGGTTGLTTSGGPITTSGTITLAGTLVVGNGGTAQSTYATGDTLYASALNTVSKLTIGSAGQVLTVAAGIPSWATLSTSAVTTFSAGTTGFTPSTATSGAITLAGTLAVTNGGTGVTGFGVVTSKTASYAVLAADSYLDFDNNGAAGSVTFTLPASTVGLAYGFAVMEAQDLVIDAPGGVTIYLGEISTTAGGTITSNAVGSYLFIKCRSATEWLAQSSLGSWTPA